MGDFLYWFLLPPALFGFHRVSKMQQMVIQCKLFVETWDQGRLEMLMASLQRLCAHTHDFFGQSLAPWIKLTLQSIFLPSEQVSLIFFTLSPKKQTASWELHWIFFIIIMMVRGPPCCSKGYQLWAERHFFQIAFGVLHWRKKSNKSKRFFSISWPTVQ